MAADDMLFPIDNLDGSDPIFDLQSQITSLRHTVAELELEKARLSSQLATCRCQKQIGENTIIQIETSSEDNQNSCQHDNGQSNNVSFDEKIVGGTRNKQRKKASGCDIKAMQHHAKRYIALKLMYFGQRFYGFASEGQMDPTVESELFKALEKTKLLVSVKHDWRYSRCGRTDKGVSSIGQVICLFLRSNCKDSEDEEIDYVRVLNKVLPRDVRVLGWCPAPTDFHARFSCSSREYKYLFWKEGLDITAMELAAKKFVGEHDFRNFCKMDAANVHNYRRQVTSFNISSCDERFDCNEVWAMTIKGSAFLWHQVRCMVAVLFMVGQGLESPSVIDALLDTSMTPRKPQYTMAPELPLILHSCEFEGLNFICSSDTWQSLYGHLKTEFQTYMVQAAIFHEALRSISAPGLSPLDIGKKRRSHIPLTLRPTEPSYRERRLKLNARGNNSKSTMTCLESDQAK